jgi:hypothetical protein
MDEDVIFLPSTGDDEGFVELAATQKGRLYRKQILHMNSSFVHPNDKSRKIFVDEKLAKSLVNNFKSGKDIVQVPIVGDDNQHSEDPTRNVGQVTDVEYDENGVYAIIDDRRPKERIAKEGELGGTLIGASALMHLAYKDTSDNSDRGPTLLHVAVTNRPYINDLGDYEEIVAASAETLGVDTPAVWSPANEAEDEMELDELLEKLKDEHGIDAIALQGDLTAATERITELEGVETPDSSKELVTALSNVLESAGVKPKKDKDDIEVIDVANAVIELSQEKLELSAKVDRLIKENDESRKREAGAEVDALVKAGRVLPKQRDTMVELALTNRETFDALVPDDAIVALSAMGVTAHDEPVNETFEQEATRLADLANSLKTKK